MIQRNKLIIFCFLSCFILISTKITLTNTLTEDSIFSNEAQTQISLQDPQYSNRESEQNDQIQGNEQQITKISKRMLQKKEQNKQAQHKNKDGNSSQNKPKRQVFDCIMYNGENHLLSLRLQIMNSFVDYFVISEGRFTFTGQKKDLVFDITNFPKYSHKILYQAVDKFPKTENVNSGRWENQQYNRNASITILNEYAKDRDVVLLSDVDQILSKQGFQQFEPDFYPWAATEMRQFYYYFNRMSVFDNKVKEEVPHISNFGTKMTTYQVLRQRFGNNIGNFKRGHSCSDNINQILNYDPLVLCIVPVMRNAGWHFTNAMNDADLLKKFRSYLRGRTDYQITNFTAQREINPNPHMYLKDFELEDAGLPKELVNDMLVNKQNSIYYPYFVKVVPNQGCQDDEVERSTGKKKIKTRIIADPKIKTIVPTQCIKAPVLEKQTEQIKQQKMESYNQNQNNSTQSQIIKDSKVKGKLKNQLLVYYFYISIIVIVVCLYFKSRQNKNGKIKEKEKGKQLKSDRLGSQRDANTNVALE